MKVQVLVQGEQWLDRAGVRIRYRRIAPHLAALGSPLAVDVIGKPLVRDRISADVVILSKCTDARGLATAELLRENGTIVGVDLFDDYFSTRTGPCLIHRQMLREMAQRADFFLCSTARMREVARDFAPDIPVHVLNDPFNDFDKASLSRRLQEKVGLARSTGKFEVLWFGNGDNPVFPVGLTDLAAFASSLEKFATCRFDVSLRILTNASALKVSNLARLRNLPLPAAAEEWSEEAERAYLDTALVSFIPVNYQPFSIAKSLNRGVSALTGGTQILSAGYPLYKSLGSFVYRDAGTLLADLEAETLKLRPDTLDALEMRMDDIADPSAEAARLHAFLTNLDQARSRILPDSSHGLRFSRAVLHGYDSSSSAHRFSHSLGWLSIGSPFTRTPRSYDVHVGFFDGSPEMQIRLTRDGLNSVRPELRKDVKDCADTASPHIAWLALPATIDRVLHDLRPDMIDSRAGRILHYRSVMQAVERLLAQVLEDTVMTRSEKEVPLMALWPNDIQAAAAE